MNLLEDERFSPIFRIYSVKKPNFRIFFYKFRWPFLNDCTQEYFALLSCIHLHCTPLHLSFLKIEGLVLSIQLVWGDLDLYYLLYKLIHRPTNEMLAW